MQQPGAHACDFVQEEVASRIQQCMPEEDVFTNLSDLYKMFSDKTRLRILWVLSCGSLCVRDLAALLGMTKSAVSHQLKSLRLANLVRARRQGKMMMYALADEHVKDIFRRGMEHISE